MGTIKEKEKETEQEKSEIREQTNEDDEMDNLQNSYDKL